MTFRNLSVVLRTPNNILNGLRKVALVQSESDVHAVAAAYLRTLANGGGVIATEVEHVSTKSVTESYILADSCRSQDLLEFVREMEAQFAAIPAVTPDAAVRPENEEEAPQFILLEGPLYSRAFAGFKREAKPVFTWDFRLAPTLSEAEAQQISECLLALGMESQARPVVAGNGGILKTERIEIKKSQRVEIQISHPNAPQCDGRNSRGYVNQVLIGPVILNIVIEEREEREERNRE
jgi:hypothetical protein